MSNIVFMGTPEFAVPSLQALINHPSYTVTCVVTQPDRPAGRGNSVQMSPIKQLALQHEIVVLQPEKIGKQAAMETLKTYAADLFVVAAFGQILPQRVLDLPRLGSYNIHASLLPRWRGAAPIQAAILAGDRESGVTIMKMDAGLDTGAMLSKVVLPLERQETGQSLHDRLSKLGADLLLATLPGIISGSITPTPQPETGITYAPRIEKDAGHIDWTTEAILIDRQVRAFTPWPGTFTYWDGRLLKIISGQGIQHGLASAGVVSVDDFERVVIGTGRGVFLPHIVQLAGKKPTTISDFVRGYPEFIGAQLQLNNP